MTELWFHVGVNPEPWAVGPIGYNRRGGKMGAYMGRNQQLDAYENAVKEAVQAQYNGPMLTGKLSVEFFFWRHRAEYTTPQARTHRKHDADATNMLKATEDALQGVLYANDKDNAEVRARIMAQGPDVEGQIVIHITDRFDPFYELIFTMPEKMRDAVEAFKADAVIPISSNVWNGPQG